MKAVVKYPEGAEIRNIYSDANGLHLGNKVCDVSQGAEIEVELPFLDCSNGSEKIQIVKVLKTTNGIGYVDVSHITLDKGSL